MADAEVAVPKKKGKRGRPKKISTVPEEVQMENARVLNEVKTRNMEKFIEVVEKPIEVVENPPVSTVTAEVPHPELEPEITMEEGMVVLPHDPVPKGWTRVPMGDGTMEAWPKAMLKYGTKFDSTICSKLLKAVDQEFEKHQPDKDNPEKLSPKIMIVNGRFKEIIKHQQSWGDNCPIVLIRDKDILPGDGPQFRVICDPSEVQKIMSGD
jgi:hypothetical protein